MKFGLATLPLLALPQLPKQQLFHIFRGQLIQLLINLGMDRGSWSPNAIMMTPYAFGLLFTVPSGVLLATGLLVGNLKRCGRWVWYLLAAAAIDGLVTIWFEQTSPLKIF